MQWKIRQTQGVGITDNQMLLLHFPIKLLFKLFAVHLNLKKLHNSQTGVLKSLSVHLLGIFLSHVS